MIIKIKKKLYFFIILLMMSYHVIVFSKDLGIIGQVYPIAEEDFLALLQKRAAIMKQNGDWIKYQNEWRTKVERNVDRPYPVKGINKTVENKIWYYDPSIVLPYDLKDTHNQVFAKAGTRINPLSFITIHKALLFINGDDDSQVKWAIKKYQSLNQQAKIVLVNGSVLQLMKKYHQRIYFDQEGKFTTRFSIHHVPAMVIEEGKQLKIEEEVADE